MIGTPVRAGKTLGVGQRIGSLVLLRASGLGWECSCDCGAERFWSSSLLESGRRRTCGACVTNRLARGVARCSRCITEKTVEAFAPRPDRPSGLRSKCKACEQELLTARHRANIDVSRAKRREYFRADPRGQARIEEERRRNPAKHRARAALHRAVDSGRLAKPSVCSRCPEKHRIEAHHDDYSKPLDVTWLCTACHRVRHRELRQLGIDPEAATRPARSVA